MVGLFEWMCMTLCICIFCDVVDIEVLCDCVCCCIVGLFDGVCSDFEYV